jgi:hypothetical protein
VAVKVIIGKRKLTGAELKNTARAIAHEALSMFEAAAEDRAMAEEITRLDELEELEEPVTETEESNHYY